MKRRIFYGLITSLICLVIFTACKYSNEGNEDVWVTAAFSVDETSNSSSKALFAVGSTESSLIVAVPAAITTVSGSSYLPTNYGKQLLNLLDNSVTLSVPLDTPMRLIKANFNELLSLDQISGLVPTAFQTGISDSFTVSIDDETKSVTITMGTADPIYPTVVSVIPADSSTGISISTTVSATFSHAMNSTTLTTNTSDTTCSGSVQLSADSFETCVTMTADPSTDSENKTFTITPDSDLENETTYQIRVTTIATDNDGDALQSDYTTANGFTTASIYPTVVSVSPADGSTDILVSTNVSVTFSQAMNSATLTTNTADTTCSGSLQLSSDSFETCVTMSADPSADSGDTTFTVTPASDLANETTYQIKVTTVATDSDANGLQSDYTTATGFTTAAEGAVVPTSTLTPLYSNGSSWNDYIKNDGSDIYSAGNTACDGTEASSDACIHGGEMRAFTVTGKTSCTNLTATDSLDAFEWTCLSASPDVKFVSTHLNSDKNLSDLIDFTATPTWKSLTATVMESGSAIMTASTTAWADNTIAVDNDGGSLDTAGTIYAVTSNPDTSFSILADKVALVVQPGLTIKGNSMASGGDMSSDVSADTVNFLWIEGSIDATNDYHGIYWDNVRFSVLRNVEVSNAAGSSGNGLEMASSRYNYLKNVTFNNNSNNGAYIRLSPFNRIEGATAVNNKSRGLFFSQSVQSRLKDITAINNQSAGLYLANSSYSSVNNVTAVNNRYGLFTLWGSDVIVNRVIATGNAEYGVYINDTSNSVFNNVTSANNKSCGLFMTDVPAVTSLPYYNNINNFVTVNNENYGVYLDGASWSSFNNLVSVSNTLYGVYVDSSNDSFSGLLKVGNQSSDCQVIGSPNPGLDISCGNAGTSSATLTSSVSLASTFSGKVTIDDVSNDSDTSGQMSAYPADPTSFDWTDFDNEFRTWGVEHSDLFPTINHRGRFGCSDATGDTEAACLAIPATWNNTGRIWDWSVTSGDTAILETLSLPTGSDTITQTWYRTSVPTQQSDCDSIFGSTFDGVDSCKTTYLKNAVEILDDGVGNENILCESGETCLFTPNNGAYQGHGNLISAGTFTDGTLTGITLMKYETNGR